MIIGLTGKNAAGKGTVASYLQTKGFIYFSLSDILRDEAKERNIEATRENLISLGNELRKKFGSKYLASKTNEKILREKKDGNDDFVIDSIRNPSEIDELRKNKDFILIGIDAPVEVRFERAKERKRIGEAATLQQFIELEKRENFNNKTNQQLDKCLKKANKTMINSSSLEELHEKIDLLLNRLSIK